MCEFIEDCEFTKLSVRILHLLGIEGPKTRNPTKFIRYIYNRVILENAVVRAAAVSSLAKFGVCVEDATVMKSVNVLLRRCLEDVDDEVRDRAAMYIKVMEEKALADVFVREGESSVSVLPTITDAAQKLHSLSPLWKTSWFRTFKTMLDTRPPSTLPLSHESPDNRPPPRSLNLAHPL